MRKILITGGAGFVGSNTALTFANKGWKVYVIDNLSRSGTKNNLNFLKKKISFKFYKCDISNYQLISKFIKKIKPNLLIHCAGQVAVTKSILDPRVDFNTNIVGSFNILESIRLFSAETKLIYMSTNKVYGNISHKKIIEKKNRYIFSGKEKNIDETCNLDFYSPYGCSKGSADQYFRDYSRIFNIDSTVLRMSCIYGNMQFGIEDHGWVTWITILSYFNKKIKIFGNGKQVRDLLFIDDLVKLFLILSRKKKSVNKVYNIGGGGENAISILELLKILELKLNRKIKFKKFKWRAGDQKVFISNNSLIKKDSKWFPETNISKGLDKVISWIGANKKTIQKILKLY